MDAQLSQRVIENLLDQVEDLSGSGGSGTEKFLFTSESVNEGHPDKLCDQVSDAIVDACFAQDANSHVAAECCAGTGFVMIFGEVTTNAKFDYEEVVRNAIKHIGYDHPDKGLDYKTCKVLNNIHGQSQEISNCVHANDQKPEDIGAGDQGHMFGYATDETPEKMPLTHTLATGLGFQLTKVRKEGPMKKLRPDGKTQVTVEYEKDLKTKSIKPLRVHTIVISTQHDADYTQEALRADLIEHVIKPIVDPKYLDSDTIYHINPSGSFVLGGPEGDGGLTGRKIIIDTYGVWGAHGGGAFSGKDPSKVDRSAAYYTRWIAKSLVTAGLCERCLVQVSYAIGVAAPLSVNVNCYGTAKRPEPEILQIVHNNFDMRAGMLVRELDMMKPKYHKTACYGHFGNCARAGDPDFTWEEPKKLNF